MQKPILQWLIYTAIFHLTVNHIEWNKSCEKWILKILDHMKNWHTRVIHMIKIEKK